MSPTRPVANSPRALFLWGSLAIVYVFWGSTYLGIRIVAESVPAFGGAAIRFGVAGAVLAVIVAIRGWRSATAPSLRITRRQVVGCVVVGTLLLAGGNGLVVLAESPQFALPSGVAALVISLNPLIMVLLRTFTGDRPRLISLIGVLIGLGGLAVLFLPGTTGDGLPVAGGLLALGAVTCWCVGSFATRWLPMPRDPFVASTYEMLAGAAVMAGIAALRREQAPWLVPDVPVRAWVALAYLIVIGSLITFTAYIWLLHHAPISLVSTYAYVNPVIALVLGAVFAGELITGRVLLAAATVVVGVILVVTIERPTSTRQDQPPPASE